MHILKQPVSYESSLQSRALSEVELVVIHCTELPDLAMARAYAEKIWYDSGTGNCGHYYVDRNGDVLEWVSPNRVAHHVKGHNRQSIGIELVNKGRYPDWHNVGAQTPTEAYPEEQIKGLVNLIKHLQSSLPNLKHVAGHEDLDQTRVPASDNPQVKVARKIDPGPLFPWHLVMPQINLINIGSHAKQYE